MSDHPLGRDRIMKLVSTIFADDLHAKRVASLASAAVGVLEGAALARDATRFACRSSAKMVETSFVIRSRSRGWSLTRSQRDPLHPGFQGLAPTK